MEALVRGRKPNEGHMAITAFEDEIPSVLVAKFAFFIYIFSSISFSQLGTLTADIDGLHQKAGSKSVIELHGNLHALRSLATGAARRCPSQQAHCFQVQSYTELDNGPVPACPTCGDPVRPNVVLFNEYLDDANLDVLRTASAKGFDVALVRTVAWGM
jgi:NAD-dependent SIR2 family protein deacetylase